MTIVRVGLALIIVFSVLSFGGVQVWSQAVIEIAAALLLTVWTIETYWNPERTIYWSALNWPLLGLIGIGIFQLALGQSAYTFLTRAELLRLCAYFIFFFLCAQAFREEVELRRIAWFIATLCFAISLLGIVQHFTSEKDIYWLPSIHVTGDPFGPYVNRNHFAGFVELTLPTGLALLLFQGVREEVFSLIALLTVVPISAMVLAGSRGGIISFAVELVALGLLARRQVAKRARAGVIAAVVLVAVALIAWLGAEKAIQRFSVLQGNDPSLSRRISMAKGALDIFGHHPVAGTGLGTLVAVYPRYETIYDGKVVDHAHNDYVELLADAGLLGGICCASFLFLLYRAARKNMATNQSGFSRAMHAGSIVAVTGLLVHSFVDFNLHIPSNALLFLLQAYLISADPIPSKRDALPGRVRTHFRPAIQMAGREV